MMSDRTTKRSPSLMSPMAMPATVRRLGHRRASAPGSCPHRGHRTPSRSIPSLRHDTDHVGNLAMSGMTATIARLAGGLADLAALGRADAPDLTHGIRWKIVVQHERIAPLTFDRIDDLRVALRAERGDDQGLGFAAREQAEPWVRGKMPTSTVIGRTSSRPRPSIRGLPSMTPPRTMSCSRSLTMAATSPALQRGVSPSLKAATISLRSLAAYRAARACP